ncbi:hypothetical protein ACHQM5_027935 [Ranunculus cassubicifolius]
MVHQEQQHHFLLVTWPAQGHINPSLEFAKRVIRTGSRVTFVTTIFGHQRMVNHSISYPGSLNFAPFSDGFDDGIKHTSDEEKERYMTEFRRLGSKALSEIVENSAKIGAPITCLINSIILPWATEVAHNLHLPSALLWIQPATVFDIYYYYFGDYKQLILEHINDSSYSITLPGLPSLRAQDLPSFFIPSSPFSPAIKLFQEQFEVLAEVPKSFRVLVNTFDDLESEALNAVENFNLIGIGPLIPSTFLETKGPSDKSFVRDLDGPKNYTDWLEAKENSSVVYVSFGSIAVLSNKQMEELARGLVDSRRPFLWVIRSSEYGSKPQAEDTDEKEIYSEILREEHTGMIVPWCSQVEVLNHPATGCFVTHCGWNSTLETVAMGVPVVAFPQWSDQGTNAKLIEDVWKIGVRVKPNEEDNIVKSEEIIRCLEEVMDAETGQDLRSNAKKWKEAARAAVSDGGSSDRNLRTFLEDVAQVHL